MEPRSDFRQDGRNDILNLKFYERAHKFPIYWGYLYFKRSVTSYLH